MDLSRTGAIKAGTAGATGSRIGLGHYKLTFTRSVSGCPAVASPGVLTSGSESRLGIAAMVEPGVGDPNSVEVFMSVPKTQGGQPADTVPDPPTPTSS